MILTPYSPFDVHETGSALLDRVLVTAFLESFPDLVYFKDRESRFIAVSKSKAARHNLTPPELIGKSDTDFFSADYAQWARAEEEDIMNTGEPVIGRQRKVVWADGREGWTLTSKMPLRDETGAIIGTFGLTKDITAQKRMEEDLERTNRNLVEASRVAGMAEIATGVLHNVGNVLTSLNVSAGIIATGLHQSKADSLGKVSALLRGHQDDLAGFLTHDPKGRRIPEFLGSLARLAGEERDRLLEEISSLQKNVDHIKEIISMQQAYATMAGTTEPLDAAELMEDSLRMNASALVRHDIQVVREFHPVAHVLAERGRVIQILVNLIRNAKYAADASGREGKTIIVRIAPGLSSGAAAKEGESPDRIRFVVADNGIGIPPENLAKIFVHGFTTRKTGHGFGLHSSAHAAKEMKGSLTVHSDGPGQGATFTLDLPAASVKPPPGPG